MTTLARMVFDDDLDEDVAGSGDPVTQWKSETDTAWPWPVTPPASEESVEDEPVEMPDAPPEESGFYNDVHLLGIFDSVEEYLRIALNGKHKARTTYLSWMHGPSNTYGKAEWHGLAGEPGFPDGKPVGAPAVAQLISKGWTRGADKLQRAFDAIVCDVRPVSVKRVKRRADQGDALDIHAVYSGNLDRAWERTSRQSRVAPQRITLVVDGAANAGSKSDAMFWRGAAVCALADKLTRAGYLVRVIAGWACMLDSGSTVCRVQVKPYDAPVDLATLAAAVALPAFFRSIGHAWGCGWADEHDEDILFGNLSAAQLAMPGEVLMSHFTNAGTQETATKWIGDQINKLQEGML